MKRVNINVRQNVHIFWQEHRTPFPMSNDPSMPPKKVWTHWLEQIWLLNMIKLSKSHNRLLSFDLAFFIVIVIIIIIMRITWYLLAGGDLTARQWNIFLRLHNITIIIIILMMIMIIVIVIIIIMRITWYLLVGGDLTGRQWNRYFCLICSSPSL